MQANLESIGIAEHLEQHRAELTKFWVRMLGASVAEDSRRCEVGGSMYMSLLSFAGVIDEPTLDVRIGGLPQPHP